MDENVRNLAAARIGGRGGRTLLSLVAGLGCYGLAACALPPYPGAGPYFAPPPPPRAGATRAGALATARAACNRQFPRKIGNYLPNAHCVNAAVERFALPTARHPDLIRLQEQVRANLCEAIDQRRLSPQDGESSMAAADRLIAEIASSRDAADGPGAEHKLASVRAMLR